jgi:hypothetical protein
MSLVEKVEQLNREISGSFDRAFSSLRQELQQRLRDSHEDLDRRITAFKPPVPVLAHEDFAPAAEHLRGEARAGALDELRDAFAALDRARSQSAVLAALIAGASGFASRTALLVSRGGELHGWGGHGFGDAEHLLADLVLTPPADGPWARLARAGVPDGAGAIQLSAADCAVLCGRIESPLPASGVLVPLVLRDRIVAVLYADQLQPQQEAAPAGGGTLALPALQSLVYVAALAIESLPFRQREATATLQTAGVAVPAEPAAAAEPAGSAEQTEPREAAKAETTEAGETAAATEPSVGPPAPAAQTVQATPETATPGTPESPKTSETPQITAPVDAATLGTAIAAAVAAAPVTATASPAPAPAAEAASAAGPAREEAPEEASAAPTPAAPPESSLGPQRTPPPSSTGAASAGSPFVSPVDLYDSPNVPLVKETAEIPVPRPLWPVAAAGADTATVARGGETAYLTDPAAAPGESAGAGTGAGENETVLLPHAALREAGASPWGKKTAEAAKGAGGSGLAVLPPLPDVPEAPGSTPEGFQMPGAGESPGAATSPTTRVPGSGGAGTLRAVPPAPPQPLASDVAGASGFAAGTQPASLSQPAPPAAAFEALRTGPLASGTPEVRPPTGVQGPGWAFATTRIQATSSEEALHEEARRLARLLVSEIKLYNEEQVEAGRRNRDIYERLREDIDRSRQMYEERVEPRLVKATDYFYQELVRILAAGDSKALGI